MTSADNRTVAYFTKLAEGFASQYGKKPCFQDRLCLFLKAVDRAYPAPAKVLDFGCGPGIMSLAIAQRGYDVLGIDGSRGMVEKAQNAAVQAGVNNVRFELAPASNSIPRSGTFDIVVCSSVLEYLVDDLAVLARLVTALKPAGTLVVSVPCATSLTGRLERLVRLLRHRGKLGLGQHFDYSLRHYERRLFARELERLGLAVARVTLFEFPWFGTVGVHLSRLRWFGAMMILEARREVRRE